MQNPRVFREYDIRGVADRDLDGDFALDLGRAIGTLIARSGGRTIALGRDPRLSSPRLHAGMAAGLCETGMRVIDVGVVATPVLYFAVFHEDADGGVQITGSHNPAEDNGFKVLRGRSTIHGAEIQQLRALIEARDFVRPAAPGELVDKSVLSAYVESARQRVQMGGRKLRVVVDAGNGAGGPFVLPLLEALGVEVVPLYCDPDGRFPNHHPDPTVPENMADLVREVAARGAEAGIALDGDADRIGVVDERGRIVWGDQLMILFAREILRELPGATFVSEVKASQALYDEIGRLGGRAIMWKVGHSLIKEKMKAERAVLAGEMSGHMFFAHRYYGFDDAIYAAARLCELLSRGDARLADLVDTLPLLHNTPEIRLPCPDEAKFEVVRRAVERFRGRFDVVDVDGARVRLDGGWGLVRASNTGPVLVLRFEAESAARLAEVRALVEGELSAILRELGVAAPAAAGSGHA
jgi:phosphomannomutase/phosphoglucomutase